MQIEAHAALIVVLRPGALGDFILTLPMLTLIREWAGSREIVLALSSGPLTLARDMEPELWDQCVSYEGTLVRDILTGRSHPDLIVAVQPEFSVPQSRLICIPPFPSPGKHQAEHLCERLVDSLSIRRDGQSLKGPIALNVREDVVRRYDQWKNENNLASSGAVVIHPGSGSEKKNWPEKKFAELISALEKRIASDILLVEGPAESGKCSRIAGLAGSNPVILQHVPTTFLYCLLRESRAYVGNDSGISHLAAASGCESMVLFGPTRPEEWAPAGKNVRVLEWNPEAPTNLDAADILSHFSF